MSAYPILYQPVYVEKRSRLTTFFRGIQRPVNTTANPAPMTVNHWYMLGGLED